MQRLRGIADAHSATFGKGAFGIQAEGKLLQRRQFGDFADLAVEDGVEHRQALRVVQFSHRIVVAVDAPHQSGATVFQRQQSRRAMAGKPLEGNAGLGVFQRHGADPGSLTVIVCHSLAHLA